MSVVHGKYVPSNIIFTVDGTRIFQGDSIELGSGAKNIVVDLEEGFTLGSDSTFRRTTDPYSSNAVDYNVESVPYTDSMNFSQWVNHYYFDFSNMNIVDEQEPEEPEEPKEPEEPEEPEEPKETTIFHVYGDNVSCELEDSETGEIISVGTGWENRVDVVVGKTYILYVHSDEGFMVDSGYIENSWGIQTPIEISEPTNKFSYTFIAGSDEGEKFYFNTIVVQPPKKISGFNHLYLVDNEKLGSLTKERFIITSGEPISTIMVDLGQFIINILELPFTIPSDVLGNDDNIILGNNKLNTVAKYITVDELVLNLGSITVPSKYNNSLDFIETTAKLHLPYHEPIDLDIEYVINHTIELEYIIDLYTGNSSINVKSSKTGKVVETKNFKLGRDIPFATANDNKRINTLSDNQGINNHVDTAFIEVIRNKPNTLNMFNNVIEIEGYLNNENGFITVNEINLETSSTLQEKNNIVQLLKNGVYIK